MNSFFVSCLGLLIYSVMMVNRKVYSEHL